MRGVYEIRTSKWTTYQKLQHNCLKLKRGRGVGRMCVKRTYKSLTILEVATLVFGFEKRNEYTKWAIPEGVASFVFGTEMIKWLREECIA